MNRCVIVNVDTSDWITVMMMTPWKDRKCYFLLWSVSERERKENNRPTHLLCAMYAYMRNQVLKWLFVLINNLAPSIAKGIFFSQISDYFSSFFIRDLSFFCQYFLVYIHLSRQNQSGWWRSNSNRMFVGKTSTHSIYMIYYWPGRKRSFVQWVLRIDHAQSQSVIIVHVSSSSDTTTWPS